MSMNHSNQIQTPNIKSLIIKNFPYYLNNVIIINYLLLTIIMKTPKKYARTKFLISFSKLQSIDQQQILH